MKAHVSQSVGDLIATVHTDLTDHELSCIKASKSFSSTTDTEGDKICCDPSMPSGAVYEMGMRYLYAEFKKKSDTVPPASSIPLGQRDGLQMLMALRREYNHLPAAR